MIARTLTAWLVAACIAMLLGGAIHLDGIDGPTDAQAEWDQSTALQDAIKSAATQARFTRAAAQLCGNTTYTVDADGAVLCQARKPRGPGVVLTRMDAPGVQP